MNCKKLFLTVATGAMATTLMAQSFWYLMFKPRSIHMLS